MPQESTPSRYLILFGFLAFPLLVLAVLTIVFPAHNPSLENKEIYTPFKYFLLLLAVCDCAFPWLLQKQTSLQISGDLLTFLGYVFTISGMIYGLILYFLGMPLSSLYLFAILSLAGTLLWGMARIRKSEEPF